MASAISPEEETLVEMTEKDNIQRTRIQTELDRVSTEANSQFLKTPLMIKHVKELIIDKQVDIEKTKNSSEIYLMMLMKNLDFHTDHDTSINNLKPAEDHNNLLMCLKLCHHQMQKCLTYGESFNTISGIERKMKNVGECFEAIGLGEVIRVPIDFIKKLGIFKYRKEKGLAYLDAVHLSFFEFCCALSLCRNDVNICEELSNIRMNPRFESIVIYLAGMFARNVSIEFLNLCKHICQNFMDLLDNNNRENSIQDVFKSIMMREGTELPYKETSTKIYLLTGEENAMTSKSIVLLVEAMGVATAKLNDLIKITILDLKSWMELNCLAQLIQLQRNEIEMLVVHNSVCELFDEQSPDFCAMMDILRVSKNSEIAELKLGCNRGSFSFIRGYHLESLSFKKVTCWQINDVRLLCAMLKESKSWTIEYLDLLNISHNNWTMLAETVDKDSVDTIRVTETGIRVAKKEDLQSIWNSTTKKWTWCGMRCHARKTEGENGLQKLLAIRNEEEEQWIKKEINLIEGKDEICDIDSFSSYASTSTSQKEDHYTPSNPKGYTSKPKQNSSFNSFELAKKIELANELKEIEKIQLDYAIRISLDLEEETERDMTSAENQDDDSMSIRTMMEQRMFLEETERNITTSIQTIMEEESLHKERKLLEELAAKDKALTKPEIMTEEQMMKNLQLEKMSLEEEATKYKAVSRIAAEVAEVDYISLNSMTEDEMIEMAIARSLSHLNESSGDDSSEDEI